MMNDDGCDRKSRIVINWEDIIYLIGGKTMVIQGDQTSTKNNN